MSYVEEFCDNIAIINKGDVVLSGHLKEIKKDYGKNRLVLSAENYDLSALSEKITGEFAGMVSVMEKKKEFLVLELLGNTTKKQFMQALGGSDIDIEHFGRYEPSLNDIFVARVGNEDEPEEKEQNNRKYA